MIGIKVEHFPILPSARVPSIFRAGQLNPLVVVVVLIMPLLLLLFLLGNVYPGEDSVATVPRGLLLMMYEWKQLIRSVLIRDVCSSGGSTKVGSRFLRAERMMGSICSGDFLQLFSGDGPNLKVLKASPGRNERNGEVSLVKDGGRRGG